MKTLKQLKARFSLTEKDKLTFGKYANMQLREIVQFDPSYIIWLNEHTSYYVNSSLLQKARRLELDQYFKRRISKIVKREKKYYDPVDVDYDDPMQWEDFGNF